MRAPSDWPCPVCGSVFQATLEHVRLERTVRCPNGHDVHLVDKDNGAQQLDQEFIKLERTMRRAGIKMKYRRR